ncbi:MAG: phytanoyl-CoA dioxygenase family protein, partial [Gammaproteobacteria bacterium]
MPNKFNSNQIDEFNRQGFIVVPGLADETLCQQMTELVEESLDPPLAPLEYETDVQYPGSPADRLSPGGETPRRLLNAYTRDKVFRDWATSPAVVDRVSQLIGAEHLELSQNHHNCIMTKHP